MSTPLYLLVALMTGALAIAAGWLVMRLVSPLLGVEAQGRRLERRRVRRLARGEDRYFEELRSIDAAIEQNAKMAAMPRDNWRRPTFLLLLPFTTLVAGMLALDWIASAFGRGGLPAWTAAISTNAVFFLLGVSYLAGPNSFPKSPAAGWAVGGTLILIGVAGAAHTLNHLPHS